MPLRVIVLVLVRLECVYLVVYGLGLFLQAMLGTVRRGAFEGSVGFGMPIVTLVVAFVLWQVGPGFARFILGTDDAPVSMGGLSLEDLYRFAFVFLGLYFALSSLAPALTWAHYTFSVAASTPSRNLEQERSLYSLFIPLITLGAGVACMLKGRLWTRKLLAWDAKTGQTGDAPQGSAAEPPAGSGASAGPLPP